MSPKTLVPALLVLVVATVTILPSGAAASSRKAQAPYRGPSEIEGGSAVIRIGAVTVHNQQVVGPVRFETRPGERFAQLKIVDQSGNPVKGHVEQRINGRSKFLGHFCGSTNRPIGIKPGRTLVVYPGTDPCGGAITGATQGFVVARFSS